MKIDSDKIVSFALVVLIVVVAIHLINTTISVRGGF